jgi:hypothetical protein
VKQLKLKGFNFEGRLWGDADKKKTPEIATAGNFNSLNGTKSRIKTARNNNENQEITVKPASSN